jgi:hypothetical protein
MGYTKYQADIAFGEVPTRKYVNVMGFNPSVGAALENVWDAGGIYTYLTTNTELFLTSSDAGDTQMVEVVGLTEDATTGDWDERTVVVALSGQSTVSTGEWIRVRHVRNFSGLVPATTATPFAGTVYLAAAGTWTAGVPDTASDIKSQINLDRNHTRNGFYTVPSGFCANIMNLETYSSSLTNITYRMRVRLFGGAFWEVQTLPTLISHSEIEFWAIENLPAKSDCEIQVIAAAGTQSIGILSSWELAALPSSSE